MKLRLLLASMLLVLSQASRADQCGNYYSGYYTCYSMIVDVSAGGQVSSTPPGLSCPGNCGSSYQAGYGNLTLTATADSGYTFTGWSGACTGSGTCTTAMTTDRVVSATFAATAPPSIIPETGFWYNASEGGRGYVIEVHSNNNLFIGGFMYDAGGNAIWYASGPGPMSANSYNGQWQQYGNGETLTGSYKPSAVVNPAVGSITVQFLSTTSGLLTLPDGRQIGIVRYPF